MLRNDGLGNFSLILKSGLLDDPSKASDDGGWLATLRNLLPYDLKLFQDEKDYKCIVCI